jgi:predicted HTH transcriptional regulator
MKSTDLEFYEIYVQLEECTNRMKKLYQRICNLSIKEEKVTPTPELILTVMKSNDGCTHSEIAEAMGADREFVRKRLYTLLKQKKVVNSGRKICNVTNAEAYCWWIKQ